MFHLYFDFSLKPGSVALTKDGAVIAQAVAPEDLDATAAALVFITDFLAQHGVALDQVTRIGCPTGPGQFTGVRLGLSIALGLTTHGTVTFFGPTTFQILAHESQGLNPSAIVVDIGAGRVLGVQRHAEGWSAPSLCEEATAGIVVTDQDIPRSFISEFHTLTTSRALMTAHLDLSQPERWSISDEIAPFYAFEPTYAKTNS